MKARCYAFVVAIASIIAVGFAPLSAEASASDPPMTP